jgi:ubiquinone/menaquinone biosynthesis C-methylase UbiE
MSADERTDAIYVHGHSSWETQRLIAQARERETSTRRLLQDAGIAAGMRVLDVGSGAGDVALLAAELVGPNGAVVGLDTNAAILETARERARAAGLANLTFHAGDFPTAALEGEFDALVGRFVLMYQRDPAAAIRAAARHVRPGGVVVFQEYDFTIGWLARPQLPLLDAFIRWTTEGGRRAGIARTMGLDLYRAFLDAGLPAPLLRAEAVIGGGPDFGGYAIATGVLRNYLPSLVEHGIATAEEVDIDTFEARFRDAVVAQQGVVMQPTTVGAWARRS